MTLQNNQYLKRYKDKSSMNAELKGLQALTSAIADNNIDTLRIPEIIDYSDTALSIQKVDVQPATEAHYLKLAMGLANLHLAKKPFYGWDQDNYIGLSEQKNSRSDNWGAFFIDHRLRYQVKKIGNKELQLRFLKVLDDTAPNLENFLNASVSYPSLLHGDLWQGNVLFGKNASVWLIDPAVYYGDSEADIAMTELFGGFPQAFYNHYNSLKQLSVDYETKRDIYNLYHNLNHLNLFGTGYLHACNNGFEVLSAFR